MAMNGADILPFGKLGKRKHVWTTVYYGYSVIGRLLDAYRFQYPPCKGGNDTSELFAIFPD
ncbi:MAG TPA: hypothetical protein VJ603_09340 [Paucimonas sp.]|nr:hypothetical protein [Paucimonas sp.]HJW54912.1 hypothetical protein [Burkholderiaceae bacterium]